MKVYYHNHTPYNNKLANELLIIYANKNLCYKSFIYPIKDYKRQCHGTDIYQGNHFNILDAAHRPWQRTDSCTMPAQTKGNSHCAKYTVLVSAEVASRLGKSLSLLKFQHD